MDAPALGFLPNVLNQNLYSAFVQDEIELRPKPFLRHRHQARAQ